eukprot:symbB.v1.2.012215.t1/scaffold833.1/size175488/5
MGFISSHLTIKKKLTNDEKQELIGNSFHAIVVARLLCRLVCTQNEVQGQDLTAILWETWTQLDEKAAQWFGLKAAGVSGVVGLRKLLLPHADVPLRAFVDPGNRLTDEEFLAYLLTRVATHRNGELRVSRTVLGRSADSQWIPGADTGAPLKWKDIPSPLQFEAGAKEVPDVLDQAVVGGDELWEFSNERTEACDLPLTLDITLLKFEVKQDLRGVVVQSTNPGDGITFPLSGNRISVHYVGKLAATQQYRTIPPRVKDLQEPYPASKNL